MRHFTAIDTPIGPLCAVEENGALVFLGRPEEMPAGGIALETPLLAQLRGELAAYFTGERRTFDLPLSFAGTPWREKCWEGLLGIPYGQTLTYAQLAAYAGKPKGARAAGGACHANPLLILIPCHRVVGASGALTGFGAGVETKAFLLRLESAAAAR